MPLHQGREQPHEAFPEALEERAVGDVLDLLNRYTVVEIGGEDLLKAESLLTVVEESVALEVVLEAAEINVQRAA